MTTRLSPRLLACCDYIRPHSRVADVGCDHGYLGLHLLQEGLADYIFACDINEGPLQSAKHNAEKYSLSHKISFYLSDGLQSVPQDFDTLVCAGMGADTIVSILEAAPWLQTPHRRLVLQCQSKTPHLRKYLSENHWKIEEETVVRDGRFLYTVMLAVQSDGAHLSSPHWYISPALIRSNSPDLLAYYRQVTDRLRRAVTGQGEKADPKLAEILVTLENDPQFSVLRR